MRLLFYFALVIIGLSAFAQPDPNALPDGNQVPPVPVRQLPVPQLLELLRSPDATVRARAADQLAPLMDPRAVEPLTAAMKDKSVEVRTAAARAYSEYREKAPIQPLLDLLKDPEDGVRNEVMRGLWMRVHPENATPAIIEQMYAMAKDPSQQVRYWAVGIIGRFPGDRTTQFLLTMLRGADTGMRVNAAFMLGQQAHPNADPAIVDALIVALKDKEPGVRQNAANALAGYRPERALEPLLAVIYNEENDPVLMTALDALGQLKDPKVLQALLDAANEFDGGPRLAALRNLGNMRDPRATDALVAALQNNNRDVQQTAALALGRQKDPRAIILLVEMLNGKDDSRAYQALDTLGNFGTAAYPVIVNALKDPRPNIKSSAESRLRSKRDTVLIPLYLPLLKEKDANLRRTVLNLLVQFHEPRVLDALISLLDDPDPGISAQAINLLSYLFPTTDPRVVPPLLKRLEGGDKDTRAAAARALGWTKNARAVPALVAALNDANEEVALSAANALARIGNDAMPALLTAAKSTSARVRLGAISALWQNSDPHAQAAIATALKDADGGVRARAVAGTRWQQDPNAAKKLLALLIDPDPRVRVIAARESYFLGEPAISPLAHAATDADNEVRIAAIGALGGITHPRALEELLPFATSKDQALRIAAIESISRQVTRYHDPRGLKVLREALLGNDAVVRTAVVNQLSSLRGAGITLLQAALADPRPEVRKLALDNIINNRDARFVPQLMKLAQDPDTGTRGRVIQTLGLIADARALPVLVAALKDDLESWNRAEAARGLGRIKDPRAIEPLLAALKDTNSYPRSTAIEALAAINPTQINDALLPLLNDPDSMPRSAAFTALAILHDRRVIEPAIRALQEDDESVRGAAARALGEMKAFEAVDALIAALQNPGVSRQSIASALGQIGDPRAIVPLLTLFDEDQDQFTQRSVIEALGKFNAPRVIDALIGILGNDSLNEWARDQAAGSLGELKAVKAIPVLVAALPESRANIGYKAAIALGKIGGPAIDRLILLLNSPNERVRSLAADGLGYAKDAKAVEPLIAALKAGDASAAEALGKLGDARAVPALIVALHSPDGYLVCNAIEALGKLHAAEAAPALLVMLKTESDTFNRCYLISALGDTGTPQAEAAILPFLTDDDLGVRSCAINAVGKLHCKAAVITLMKLLDTEEEKTTRADIAYTLGLIGDSRAVPALIGLLGDVNQEPRARAVEALRAITGKEFGTDAEKWLAWWNTQPPKP